MDGHRFDRIARGLAAGRTRRGIVKGLGAAALGGLGLARPGGAAADGDPAGDCKAASKDCKKDAQCCAAPAPCAGNTPCTTGADCCSGECIGVVSGEVGSCCPKCPPACFCGSTEEDLLACQGGDTGTLCASSAECGPGEACISGSCFTTCAPLP